MKLAVAGANCPNCKLVEQMLERDNVDYDIVLSEEYTDELIKDGVYSLPAILIGNTWKHITPVNYHETMKEVLK